VHLLRGGADIKTVKDLLGHADIETTKAYLRLVPGFLAEVYHRHMPEIQVQLMGIPGVGLGVESKNLSVRKSPRCFPRTGLPGRRDSRGYC
jgi:hypothetical protein